MKAISKSFCLFLTLCLATACEIGLPPVYPGENAGDVLEYYSPYILSCLKDQSLAGDGLGFPKAVIINSLDALQLDALEEDAVAALRGIDFSTHSLVVGCVGARASNCTVTRQDALFSKDGKQVTLHLEMGTKGEVGAAVMCRLYFVAIYDKLPDCTPEIKIVDQLPSGPSKE